jgi:cation/acetate symporter
MGLWALSLAAGSFFAPLVLSIWWREISRQAVFASMAAGAASTLLVILLSWFGIADSFLGISNLTAAIVGVPVAFAAAAAVAYRQRDVSPVVSEVLDEIRIPDGETVYDYKERLVSGRGF